MPFKSEAQRRKFYAMEDKGEISKKTLNEWERSTKRQKKGKLPERVSEKDSCGGPAKMSSAFYSGYLSEMLDLALSGRVKTAGILDTVDMLAHHPHLSDHDLRALGLHEYIGRR